MRRMGLIAGEDLHSAAVIDRLLRGPVGLVKSRHYTPTLDARVALARGYPPTDFTPTPRSGEPYAPPPRSCSRQCIV